MKTLLSVTQIRRYALTLLLLLRAPSHSMNEGELITAGERTTWLTKSDRESVPSRHDSRFANWIHNFVAHRTSRKNPIRLRLIEWDPRFSSFSIGPKGTDFLKKLAEQLRADDCNDFRVIENWLIRTAIQQSDGADS